MALWIIQEPIHWLQDPFWAKVLIILAITWRWTGYNMVFYLAALQNIDRSIFEAARIDGASAWDRFWHITVPMLKPVIVTVVVFRLIDTLKVFDLVFGLTGGGPLRRTEAVQTLAYQTAFKFSNFGEAAATVVIFAALIFAICMAYGALDRREEGAE